jgi:hypothetical protein
VKRDAGKVIELPEVHQTVHPNVECAIHPGRAIGGVAVCVHVLDGAAVFIMAEPDHDRWGSVLCEECAGLERAHLQVRLACVKCVRYHFSRDRESAEQTADLEPMTERELLSMAEKEGLRQYRRSVRVINPIPAACPFTTPLMRDIWQLGFRLGRYLDECRQALPQALAAKGESGSA